MSEAQHRLALPAGYELGRYRFQQILGSGGFGITYLAEDKTLRRKVAVKELLPNEIATRIDGTTVVAKTESEEESLTWARERFVDEGRALAACDHPNVVNVYEMVEANGTAYMVTKYEEGRSLAQWLNELGRPPNESELRSILMPLLSGLETVHQAGFLHRDIKPENIYITKNGRPVLLDFGSARQAIGNRSMAMTSIVTAGYAPFEQYHEDGNQGAWSDIYALGAVMYRAITGKKPPDATRRLKEDPAEKLASRYAGQYDAEFLRAIDRALAVDEGKRPQSIAEWRKMLGDGDRLPLDSDKTRVLPRPKPKDPVWLEFVRENWMALAGGALGVLFLILILELFLRRGGHSEPPRIVVNPSPSVAPSVAPVSPQPGPAISPNSGNNSANVSPAPGGPAAVSPTPIAPGISPGPSAAPVFAQLDPRLAGTWETRIAWPPVVPTNPIGAWQDGNGIRTVLPDGTETRKDTTGKSNDSAGHWTMSDGQFVLKDTDIQEGVDIGVTYRMTFSPDGKRLSGRWAAADGVPANPSSGEASWQRVSTNSPHQEKVRWELANDGHYTFSGPLSETGVMTATADGKLQQVPNTGSQAIALTYEFRGDKLITNGPLGTAEWHRVGTTTSKNSSHSREQPSSTNRREYKVHPTDILRRAFRGRFP